MLPLVTDFSSDANYEFGKYEIIVGLTNRPESEEFFGSLESDEYGFTVINGKIVLWKQ